MGIGVYWTDDEGRLRLREDDNYQMVDSPPPFEVWLLMGSWGIDLACKMIVLGYNEDTNYTIEYGLKECPHGTTGRDRAHALITVMNRILTLAHAAIAIGKIKETDTPANWIAWAQTKGYNTDHLNPQLQIQSLQDAIQKSENAGCIESYNEQIEDWKKVIFALHIKTINDKPTAITEPLPDSKPWLIPEPNDPRPEGFQDWYTPARYFARRLVKDDSTLLVKRVLLAVKVSQSLENVGILSRSKKAFDAGTIKKAFVNVNLG